MARESTITFDQVATVADRMKANGEKPTTRAVRDALGTGSMATVLKMLQQWQAGQERQSHAIDDTLDPTVTRAISNQIAAKVQEATADATARLADLQGEAAIIIAESERQAAEIEGKASEILVLQEQCAALAGRAQQLEADAGRTAADLEAQRHAAEGARLELAMAKVQLDAMPAYAEELKALRGELETALVRAADQHEAAAVASAKLDAAEAARVKADNQLDAATVKEAATAKLLENERVALQACQTSLEGAAREVAGLKEAFDAAQAKAEKRLETLTVKDAATSKLLENERVSVQACQARLEGAAREIESAKSATVEARAASKKSSEEAAELRGQLAALGKAKK